MSGALRADGTLADMDVRHLAAIDMYGTRGTIRRRRAILVEFIAGTALPAAFGIWLLWVSTGLGEHLLGIWMVGSALNYAVLTAHAITLSRAGALEAELAGIDTDAELRRYSVLQLWVLVPLSLVVLAVRDTVAHAG